MKDKFSQEARSFVNDVFIDELRKRYREEQKDMLRPIDLSAGGRHNMDRFTQFVVPSEHTTSYNMRVKDSAESIHNLSLSQVRQVCHVFFNLEQYIFKLVVDYYGDDQLEGVANDIVQTTMMYQSMLLGIIDSRDKMANAFYDVSRGPGSKRIMNQLQMRIGQHIPAEKITINYIVQDLAQTYINCISEGLRTDMISMSQFTYQLGMLAENVSEVLSVLNDDFYKSD